MTKNGNSIFSTFFNELDNKSTKVVNALSPISDHRSIDNDLSKKVTEVVKRELIPNQQ